MRPRCDSTGSNYGALGREQCLQHSLYGTTMPRRRERTPVEHLQPFAQGRIVACGKLDGYIDELLHMLDTMYRWSAAALSSGVWNIPISVDQVLDGRVV